MSPLMIQATTQYQDTSGVVTPSQVVVSPKNQYDQRPTSKTGNPNSFLNSHSSLASKAIADGNYAKALELYKLALKEYLQGAPTVVELVNAAATCFNLGALSKKLQNFSEASSYFCQAEDLYKSCWVKVGKAPQNNIDTTRADPSDASCDVCLYQLIVETIQARAHLHYKYQNNLDEAIECHEEVVDVLERQRDEDRDIIHFRIHFTRLSPEMRWHLLVTSLQSLGKFYVERGEFEDGLVAYQEALSALKQQHSRTLSTKQRQDEVSQIIRALSDIYMKVNKASIRVPELQNLARLQEKLRHWNKAISCWERVLFLQSQQYGEESTEVADVLCQIARVMVEQGNHEGALDLYHASAAKYRQTSTPPPRDLVVNITSVFCLMGLHEESLEWLDSLEDDVHEPDLESLIASQRGRVFLEQGRVQEASQELCRSAQLQESPDEYVFSLLQRLEFLEQRLESSSNNNAVAKGSLELPLESIMEVDECSTVTRDLKDEISLENSISLKQSVSGTSISVGRKPLATLDEQRAEDFNPVTAVNSGDSSKRDQYESFDMSLSVASNKDRNGDEEEFDDVQCPDDESVAAKDIIQEEYCARVGESSPRGSHHVIIRVVSSNDSPRLETIDYDFSPSYRREDGSKATQETELSVDSDTGRSPRSTVEGGLPAESDHTIDSQDAAPDPTFSYDGSESESGFYFRGGSREEAANKIEMEGTRTLGDDLSEGEECDDLKILDDVENDLDDESVDDSVDDSADGSVDEAVGDAVDEPAGALPDHQVVEPVGEQLDDPFDDPVKDQADELLDVGSHSTSKSPVNGEVTAGNVRSFARSLDEELPDNEVPPALEVQSFSAGSSHSRKGLLQKEAKQAPSPTSKSLKIPSLASPRNQKTKGQYVEIAQPSKAAPRNRIVKALASPFRRSKVRRNTFANGLDALHEDKEIKATLPSATDKASGAALDNGALEEAVDAPVSFISTRHRDDDDETVVSQITFKFEEQSSQRSNSDSQWWWGVTAEGLEGWFPSSYVNQAVEAAEGFLSARAIHERVQSRPLDFDSDEDSEDFQEGNSVAKTKAQSSSGQTDVAKKPESVARKVSIESTRPSNGSVSAAQSRSHSSKKSTVAFQIEEKVTLLEAVKKSSGPKHLSVASALNELAALYGKNGEIKEALSCAQDALAIQKAHLKMADACKTLHFIADIHSREKQYNIALSTYSEAQQLQEAVFGYYHEETAHTLNKIGNLLARQGEFDLAMENHKEALGILKEVCGEDVNNPLVSHTLIQIGAVYYKERNSLVTIQANTDGYSTFIEGGMLEVIGRAHEERGSYRMAIAFFEEKLQFLDSSEDSDDLEQVAETLNSLGMLSCRAGLYLEAIDYYDRALGIQMKMGCDDVQLAMARVLAGSVQYSLGHFQKALKLFEDAIRTLSSNIGHEQETVAATRYHMGVVRVALCDFENAMSDLQHAFKTQKKLLGNDHPATLRTRREIGNLYAVYDSELDSAFEEYNIVLETQKRIHGESHPNVAETLHSIGCAQARKGDYSAALRTLEDCYNMRLEFLGMDHPLQATTLHEISKIQLGRGRIKKAIHICDSALHIRKESLSETHVDVALALTTKGSCLVAKGDFNEANKTFLEALSIALEAVGKTHPTVAEIHVQLGVMHLRKCHFDEASQEINRALDIYRASMLDDDHPGIKNALEELERVERAEMLCV